MSSRCIPSEECPSRLHTGTEERPSHDKPLKRKYEASSSEYDGPIIERHEFRFGFPKPLPKDPVDILPVALNHPRKQIWTHVKNEAVRLLQEDGVDFESVSVFMRRGHGAVQPAATMIIATPDLQFQDRWDSVLVSIAKMLFSNKSLDLHVEINSPEAYIVKRIYALPLKHPIVQTEAVPWNTVSVFLYGENRPSAKPTVVITTDDIDHSSWNTVQDQLTHLLTSRSTGLELKIKEDNVAGAFTSHKPNQLGYRSQWGYKCETAIGHSIGVEEKGGGALGGFIRLQSSDNKLSPPYALTNYHVVRGSRESWPEEIDDGRFQFGDWPEDGVTVYAPAKADFKQELNALDEDITNLKADTTTSPLALKVEFELASEDQKRFHEENLDQLRITEQRKADLTGISLDFGSVKAASGYTTCALRSSSPEVEKCCALDWALVEVMPARIRGNLIPANNELDGLFNRFNKGNCREVPEIGLQFELLGDAYFKIGRTTDLTIGKQNGVETSVTVTLPLNSSDTEPYPPKDQRRKRITQEFTIVSASTNSNLPFLNEGDSGSWVLDRSGSLVGLCWGLAMNGRSAYVTPIGYIIADIEKKTGKRVVLFRL